MVGLFIEISPFRLWYEEETARRAWWDSRLLTGGPRTVPQLASCREDGCSGDVQASVWKQWTVCHVSRRLAFVSPLLFWRFFKDTKGIKHGVSNTSDPQTGGLGFNHRRMVLRPPSKYICQCFAPLHLAFPIMFSLYALHGKKLFLFFVRGTVWLWDAVPYYEYNSTLYSTVSIPLT